MSRPRRRHLGGDLAGVPGLGLGVAEGAHPGVHRARRLSGPGQPAAGPAAAQGPASGRARRDGSGCPGCPDPCG